MAILDSRAGGRVTVLTGPGQEMVFSDTRLVLDPLRLADLETLGYVDRLPLLGTVTGEIASLDVLNAGSGGPLRIGLNAALTPRDNPGATPSVLAAAGLVRWAPGEDPLRFQSLRVEAKPLRLEHLASLTEKPNPMLRGVLTGTATVSGSAKDLRILDGDLAYAVGDAPETVLRGLSGRFQAGETPRWEFSARAQPLAHGADQPAVQPLQGTLGRFVVGARFQAGVRLLDRQQEGVPVQRPVQQLDGILADHPREQRVAHQPVIQRHVAPRRRQPHGGRATCALRRERNPPLLQRPERVGDTVLAYVQHHQLVEQAPRPVHDGDAEGGALLLGREVPDSTGQVVQIDGGARQVIGRQSRIRAACQCRDQPEEVAILEVMYR